MPRNIEKGSLTVLSFGPSAERILGKTNLPVQPQETLYFHYFPSTVQVQTAHSFSELAFNPRHKVVQLNAIKPKNVKFTLFFNDYGNDDIQLDINLRNKKKNRFMSTVESLDMLERMASSFPKFLFYPEVLLSNVLPYPFRGVIRSLDINIDLWYPKNVSIGKYKGKIPARAKVNITITESDNSVLQPKRIK